MDRKKLVAAASLVAVLALGGGVAFATAGDTGGGENEAGEREAEVPAGAAGVDRAAAERAALAAVPGEVRETELEREGGAVIYEVEVLAGDGSLKEVTVAADDGRVLGQETEGPEGQENDG